MNKFFLAALTVLCFHANASLSAETVTTKWGGDALMMYDTGFTESVMKAPDGGVRLFDMDLFENDGPGAGRSEKGVSSDTVWGLSLIHI